MSEAFATLIAANWLDILREGVLAIWSRPILLITLFVVPLLLAAIIRRSYPNLPLVLLFTIPTLISTLLVARLDVLPLIVAVDLVVGLTAAFDLFCTPGARHFQVDRTCLKIASLQRPHAVSLSISYRGKLVQFVEFRDDVPQEFEPNPKTFLLRVAPNSRSSVHYEMKASRRGAFQMKRVYLRARSRLGLWQRMIDLPADNTIHVYPDMQQLSKYALLARTNRLSLMGVRRTRRIGTDNEFERLRDYTPDDNYRHLDWRATARRNKLTVRDFQTSQSQRLIFLIDCGRMMNNLSSGLSLLDHSLNAMLMLSYVALQRGDSVGMIAFSDQVHSSVPPRGGMNQMNQLLHSSFDQFPSLVESRYDQAFLYLSSHCQKRSLVVLVTNVIDAVNAHQVHQYLSTISGRHLPLGVLLRDHQIFDAAEQPFPSGEQLFTSGAAAEILNWRHQVITALEHAGVLSLDVFPEDMTAPLVNQYLQIKARHLL